MSVINTLRSERAKVNTAVQGLAKIEAESGSLTAEQQTEFKELTAKFTELTAKIERAEQAERIAAAAAVPVDEPAAPPARTVNRDPATAKAPDVPGARVARMVRALVAAQGDPRRAAQIADERGFGSDVSMALNDSTPGSGGVLVPENLSSEVIELLRPKTVVRRLGARSLPLVNGNLTIPRLKGGAVVGYIGRDSDVPVTQQTFDDLKLTSKKLAALVPISNDLLQYAGISPNVDAVVVGDLTSGISTREDKAFIRDDGTNNTPKGLLFWAIAGNKFDASDGSTLQLIETDLSKLVLLLENANANMTSPGWIMSPRVYRFLESLRNANGSKVYPTLEGQQPTLKGYPVATTTQVPSNLGTGANESEVYFADFGDCFIGEDTGLLIDYSKEASYSDGTNTISAFQRDQTLVRVIAKHDFGPRHVESIAVMQKVKWGG